MGKARTHVHSFNVGEMSASALARIDQERLRLAAETQENIFGRVIGKGQMRPSTCYLGETMSNNRARFVPFVKSVSDTAVLELTAGKIRFWVGDALVTRPSVSSTVTNGLFGGPSGWTLTSVNGGVAVVSSNRLTMYSPYKGGSATARQAVTTSSANVEHALNIVISRGKVQFRCGTAAGLDEYIPETTLEEGTHSLTFTPTGTYHIEFFTTSLTEVWVSSVTVGSAGFLVLDAPWSEDDLRLIRYDQSADVVFLACANWQQRKIERRNNARSWSIVKYYASLGPFTSARTATVKLTPAATRGNTTLTADRAFFRATHVGALFKLYHSGQYVDQTLGAVNEFTDAIKVTGLGTQNRSWNVFSGGTYAATLQEQRSIDGPDFGFANTSNSYPRPPSVINTVNEDSPEFDNVVAWYRYIVSSYTSGAPSVQIAYSGGGGHGICRVLSFVSQFQVTVEVLEPFNGTTATEEWYEGEWSSRRGWPTAVAFHDGRLCWARGSKFWLSESDDYYKFGLTDDEDLTDASSISRSIATSGPVDAAAWMLSMQRLIIGTQGAETVAKSNSFDEPLKPTTTQVKNVSTQGSALVTPAMIDRRGIFVQRSNTKVYELAYSVENQDYDTANLTEYNEDIGLGGIVELAVQRQPDTYLWMVRADGQCPILIYEPRQRVMGWMRFVTDGGSGVVETVTALPGSTGEDVVYLGVRRTLNGTITRFVEKLALHSEARGGEINKMADCGSLTAGPVSSVTIARFANTTGLIGWATDASNAQVALTGLSANGSGVISLGATYTNIWIGLPYTGRYKSAKLAHGGEGGTSLLARKRVGPIGMLLENTHPDGVYFGPNFDTMDQMPRIEEGTGTGSAVRTTYDEMSIPFEGEWDTDSRVCLKVQAPYPATFAGLVVTVETNE